MICKDLVRFGAVLLVGGSILLVLGRGNRDAMSFAVGVAWSGIVVLACEGAKLL